MAVTDLTDSLPWWTRQGAGPTGGPAATPQGGGVGGQAPPGMNQQAWLQYLMQMYNPMGAQGPNPANMPSPGASEMGLTIVDNTADHGTGDNPPVTPFAIPGTPIAGQPPINNFSNPPPANGPGPGNVGPVPLTPPSPSILPQARGAAVPPDPSAPPGPSGAMPARPAGVSASGLPLQPGSLAPGALAQFNNGGAGGYVPSPSGGGSMNPTAPPPAGQQAVGGVPGALSSGGAGGVGATSNPRFVQLDRGQNMDPTARRGAPQMTALNLAGLFGGGQPAAAATGAQNVPLNQTPMPPRRPTVPGPLASAPMPPTMPDDIRRQRAIQLAAARSGFA